MRGRRFWAARRIGSTFHHGEGKIADPKTGDRATEAEGVGNPR